MLKVTAERRQVETEFGDNRSVLKERRKPPVQLPVTVKSEQVKDMSQWASTHLVWLDDFLLKFPRDASARALRGHSRRRLQRCLAVGWALPCELAAPLNSGVAEI